MRNFFVTYSSNRKLAPLVREIGWSHNVIIMERCQDMQQREFYIRMAAYRIVRRLPAELKVKLPEPKQIERLLTAVEVHKGG